MIFYAATSARTRAATVVGEGGTTRGGGFGWVERFVMHRCTRQGEGGGPARLFSRFSGTVFADEAPSLPGPASPLRGCPAGASFADGAAGLAPLHRGRGGPLSAPFFGGFFGASEKRRRPCGPWPLLRRCSGSTRLKALRCEARSSLQAEPRQKTRRRGEAKAGGMQKQAKAGGMMMTEQN